MIDRNTKSLDGLPEGKISIGEEKEHSGELIIKRKDAIMENNVTKKLSVELSVEDITERYVNKNQTAQFIADELGVNVETLKDFIKRKGIRKRVANQESPAKDLGEIGENISSVCKCKCGSLSTEAYDKVIEEINKRIQSVSVELDTLFSVKNMVEFLRDGGEKGE